MRSGLEHHGRRVRSFLNRLAEPLRLRRLARGPRRLDACAAQVALLLGSAGISGIAGRSVLELGVGRIPGHALCMHLLGAARVEAWDIAPLASARGLAGAIAAADPSLVRDVLSPFAPHHDIRRRLETARTIAASTPAALARYGIHLRIHAPGIAPEPGSQDLIYSLSVAEHLPAADLPGWLAGQYAALRPGGTLLHAIHLEDHHDPLRSPWAHRHLGGAHDGRGNGLPADAILAIAAALPGATVRTLWRWERHDVPADTDGDRTSHLGLAVERPI